MIFADVRINSMRCRAAPHKTIKCQWFGKCGGGTRERVVGVAVVDSVVSVVSAPHNTMACGVGVFSAVVSAVKCTSTTRLALHNTQKAL